MDYTEEKHIITKVLAAKNAAELFESLQPADFKEKYKRYSKIHPDICKLPDAEEAFKKLNQFKTELEKGESYIDDAGTVTYSFNKVTFKGDNSLLCKSLFNYQCLMDLNDPSSLHFKKYLPVSGEMVAPGELVFTLDKRAVPLTKLGVTEQKHVNWILSRMLEFTAWLNQVDYCHAGINPNSIYVIPENHGLVCVSFYHTSRIDDKLKTLSGAWSGFYPSQVFTNKKASKDIDVELAKRTAVWLLGDKSGIGTSLSKTHNKAVISFLQKMENNPAKAYLDYRAMLDNNFDTKQFNKLII